MGKIFRKTYGIYGMVEHSILLGKSGSNVRIDFKDGRITVRGVEPCTFTTESKAVQDLIEQTDKFKQKYIRIVRKESIDIPDDEVQPVVEATSISESNANVEGCESGNVFEDVKNSQQAKKVLMEVYSVPLNELGNAEVIREKAVSLGVIFPNWK